MTSTPVPRSRGLGARLTPLIIALGALPLMAPTCGSSGEGEKVFARRSLIIPMDVCYQYMTDGVRTSYTPAGGATECPSVDQGDVIRAYGLVYQLVRNGIPVYWVIDNAKASVTGVDLTVQYQGGFPVFLFDWTTGLEGPAPTLGGDGKTIHYRGGPFVVDGSDYARAATVLQSFRSTFGAVNVHVSNVSFKGYAKRTMAGGWSAGGAVPPKLALLDIGSSGAGSKNSSVVIRGYLTRAGLDTPGAAGTATGPHGEIFDRLLMPDFVPTTGVAGDWTRTNLAKNKYQILWVPHWAAPSSCSDCPPSTSCTCAVKYPQSDITAALNTIGSFVTQVNPFTVTPENPTGSRGDLFAECAGLGSFEGVFGSADPSPTGVNAVYGAGVATTHTHTEPPTGVWINKTTGSALYRGNYSSPLMQIGDYPFLPRTGAIQNFKPNAYKTEVVRLISEASSPSQAYDIFTLVPGSASHGTIVYMGGHSYSGTDGAFEVAGARLVLNTLFNLGSTCTATGVPCQSGLPGVCSQGTFQCQGDRAVCVPDVQPGARTEICNGLDDDCDGQVDEGLQQECYEAPPGYVDPDGRTGAAFLQSQTQGLCRPGIKVCQQNPDGSYGMSACGGQVLPVAESCNGLDDDCDTTVDDGIPAIVCYDGPPGTSGVGVCRPGTQVCQNGAFGAPAGPSFVPGACDGDVLPRPEVCGDAGGADPQDDDCDGVTNNGCTCTLGQQVTCFPGPGQAGVGVCHTGLQTCVAAGPSTGWGPCPASTTEQGPGVARVADLVNPEACVPTACYDAGQASCDRTPYDTNCDGIVTRCPPCVLGAKRSCYGNDPTEPPYAGVGQCARGTQTCGPDGFGECTGFVLPSIDLEGQPIEYCDNEDNDCNGVTDESAVCPVGDTCLRGVCVPATCGVERPPPEGYACGSGTVVSSACGDIPSPGCQPGAVCQYGNCVDPCPEAFDPVAGATVSTVCGRGTVCGGGACIGGSCYEAGCLNAGDLCLGGTCVADPCAGKLCPSGTFCRQGDCVQACTFVTCGSGERCGVDGFCEPDLCAGRLCGAGQKCSGGACVPDPCLGKGCAAGQICVAEGATPQTAVGVCVDDPCTGVVCPAGRCAGGQCYPSGNPSGAGSGSQTSSDSGGCGCGSGEGAALPALLALLAAPLARRRRRPGAGRGGLLLALAAVALVASACKDTSETQAQFDPSGCAATCGEQRCVDIRTDPSHCGVVEATACGHACAPGEKCVDGACGPSSMVAPYIRSLNPSSGAKDVKELVVTASGDRFQVNAQLRLTTPAGPRTLACPTAAGASCSPAGTCPTPWCRWVSASALSVGVDTTGLPSTDPWTFRVVNPDGVISNAVTFGITVPRPSVAGVDPNVVLAGTSVVLGVSGSGFTAGSRCQLSPTPGVLPSTFVAPTHLDCVLNATSMLPGAFTLTVLPESGPASNGVGVTVQPSDPVVFAVDPSSATTVASFRISGARFDTSTARVLFDGTPLDPANVTILDQGNILVANLPVGGGTPRPNDSYSVQVRNGADPGPYRTSNGVAFTVGSTPPAITSFTPSTTYQGEPAVVLTFTGTLFPGSSQIELQPPGSTVFTPVPGTTVACPTSCTATATKSFVGQPEGQWLARLRFGTAAADPTSAPWPLRVLSNQAILRDYRASPAPEQGAAAGTSKTGFTFDVSNIRGPDFSQVHVQLVDPSGAVTATLDANPNPTAASTQLTTGGLSFAGYPTGTYTFRVMNPNATPSNALPFAVTPGAPTIAHSGGVGGVCVAGTSCVQHAPQGDAPLTLRITGTNFAAPDVNGNGSAVMVAAEFVENFPLPDPCLIVTTGGTQFQRALGTVDVRSASEILLTFDSRAAFVDPDFGTTYYVSIWNPGATGLQKSDCNKTVNRPNLPWFRLCASATGPCNQ